MVELKNGYTFNGTLTNMDSFMNVAMRTVIKTAPVREENIRIKGHGR